MFRKLLTGAAIMAFLSLPSVAAEYGTPEEARAMLDRVVEAIKADKSAALDKINKGDASFRDRDLYGGLRGQVPPGPSRTSQAQQRGVDGIPRSAQLLG